MSKKRRKVDKITVSEAINELGINGLKVENSEENGITKLIKSTGPSQPTPPHPHIAVENITTVAKFTTPILKGNSRIIYELLTKELENPSIRTTRFIGYTSLANQLSLTKKTIYNIVTKLQTLNLIKKLETDNNKGSKYKIPAVEIPSTVENNTTVVNIAPVV